MILQLKNPARRQTKTELYATTISLREKYNKVSPLTPEQAVEIFGQDILEIVVHNLCGQYLKLFDLTDQIQELERIIPKLPVISNTISIRGLYEAMLPRLYRDRHKCRRHIRFLGRCYDLLNGTALFRSKPTRGRVDIEALKATTDIASVLSRDVELRPSGRNFKARCPFHDDRTPSLVVYPETKRWWCFACNEGGDAISYIRKSKSCGFREAVKELQTL